MRLSTFVVAVVCAALAGEAAAAPKRPLTPEQARKAALHHHHMCQVGYSVCMMVEHKRHNPASAFVCRGRERDCEARA